MDGPGSGAGGETPPSVHLDLILGRREARRPLRFAFAAAAALHLGVLAVRLPERYIDLSRLDRPLLHRIRPFRLEAPPPPPPALVPAPVPAPPPPAAPAPPELPPPAVAPEPPPAEAPEPPFPPAPPRLPDSSLPDVPFAQDYVLVGGDITPPVVLYGPEPAYPELARKARLQGRVVVQAAIGRDGEVAAVRLIKGLPLGLSEAVIEAIRSWRFEPALLSGEPVPVYYNLTVLYELR